MDKTVVVGAGLIGLTSAYFLAARGHSVTILERCAGPGLETSFANGGLLTPSMADPWNAPGVHRQLLKWIGRNDAPMLLRWSTLPSLIGWGMAFLRQSSPARFDRNMRANHVLALRSLEAMRALPEVALRPTGHGTMKVFRHSEALDASTRLAERLASGGLRCTRLDAAGVVNVEPQLAAIEEQIVGGLLYPDDMYGDARHFCLQLAERLQAGGVEIIYDATVLDIATDARGVSGLRYRKGAAPADEAFIAADRVVIAAGSHSPALLAARKIRLPVKPVKGYSLTFDAPLPLPRIPVIDDGLHAAVIPLAGRLRIAGTAEFCGFDRSVPATRIRNLENLLASIYPRLSEAIVPGSGQAWSGLRPVSADGVPIIGATSVPGLYVNTGHGHLGWTLAAGSGQLLADMVSGGAVTLSPAGGLDVSPYSPSRFA